jgi:DNA helicase-2/ATP-dependent DNA helicase PcrA
MAGFRVLRLLPGVGPSTAGRLLDAIAQSPEPSSALASFEPAVALAEAWRSFVALLRTLRAEVAAWPAALDAVIAWYDPHLVRNFDDAFVRRGDLVQLQHIASTYRSRERFLTELTLDPPAATSDEAGPPGRDDDYLILSTIHSAKGQEWKAVHVLNVVDGCIPSDMATGTTEEIEEERRLLYVAMTRAKDELDLISPQRFFVRQQNAYGDRHVYALRSRFVPNAISEYFECCADSSAVQAEESGAAVGAAPVARIDVAARVRAGWKRAG